MTNGRVLDRLKVWSAVFLPCVFVGSATPEPSSESRIITPAARSDSHFADPDPHWLTRVEDALAAREYQATVGRDGLQAPNRAHDLRTYFETSGIRVHDRTSRADAELLRLSLIAIGRGAHRVPVARGEDVVVEKGRVEIRRPGLVEWYVNTPAGLEQGFTLETAPGSDSRTMEPDGSPVGASRPDALVLELALSRAQARRSGNDLELTTEAGRALSYGALSVVDAAGEPLAARFEVPAPDRIHLVVDDAGATYPIVIDPLLTEALDARIESNQIDAQLGLSVAGAGDVNGDGYDDVIVGAHLYDAGLSDEGAAFIFHGGPSGIATAGAASAATQLESDQSFDPANPFLGSTPGFGVSVSGAGDVNGDGYDDVIVGAPFYDAGQLDEGAAFVFLGSPSGVADGNPATAAAQLESNLAYSPFFPMILATSFGRQVSGAGDVNGDGYADVLVGAIGYDAGETDEGAVFVFLGSASGIADGNPTTAASRLQSNQANALFGGSLSSAGDVNGDEYDDVIVGADSYQGRGAAFVFYGGASGIPDSNPETTGVTQLVSTQTGSAFGTGVSGAGDINGDGFADLIVGAPSYDAGQIDEGGAFVFTGDPDGLADGSEASGVRLESDQPGSMFGRSVAGLGDVNGDGHSDVAVGAYLYDAGQADEGGVFVFAGGATGISPGRAGDALARLESDQANAWLGWSVAGAGDVNRDGDADLIAGAHLFDAGQSNEGAAFVSLGPAGDSLFSTDFGSGVPVGSSLAGTAVIENGVLKLTQALAFQGGHFVVDDLDQGAPVAGFSVRFRAYVGGGTCCSGATGDGFSFNFASDLPSDYPGEEGGGTGLTVAFDSWLNQEATPPDAAPAIEIKWNGSLISRVITPVSQGMNAPESYWNVRINLDPDGTFDVYFDDTIIGNVQTGYTPIAGGRFGFGARTGGANDNHWIDDLRISTIRVPEPSSRPMLVAGCVFVAALRRRRASA